MKIREQYQSALSETPKYPTQLPTGVYRSIKMDHWFLVVIRGMSFFISTKNPDNSNMADISVRIHEPEWIRYNGVLEISND